MFVGRGGCFSYVAQPDVRVFVIRFFGFLRRAVSLGGVAVDE